MTQIEIRKFNIQSKEDPISWKDLGLQWLQGYHHHAGKLPNLLEDNDFIILDHPVKNIIQLGGEIWFAEYINNGKIKTVGTIGLCQHNQEWEIIKLAVYPEFQGQGIGKMLIQTAIDHANQKDINRLVLDSNSQLNTALRLYESFGFQHIPTRGHYETADIAMELLLV